MLRAARREPSAILLAVQLGALLLYPFMEGSEVGRALFSVVGIGVLGLVLLAVRSSPAHNWVAVVLGLPATVLLMVQAITHSTEHRTQISAIITQLGVEPPDMSGWKYMEEIGELQEFGAAAEGT